VLWVIDAFKSDVCGIAQCVCRGLSCAVQEVMAALTSITCKADAAPVS